MIGRQNLLDMVATEAIEDYTTEELPLKLAAPSPTHPAIVIGGAPYSGKGTQCKLLVAANPRLFHASTGDIIRESFAKRLPEVEWYQAEYAQGKLYPDGKMRDLFRAWREEKMREGVYDPAIHILLSDGYPRTVNQIGDDLDYRAVLLFSGLTRGKLLDRAAARREQMIAAGLQPRPDDSPPVAADRLLRYLSVTMPAYDALESRGVPVVTIDADQPIADVHADVRYALERRGLW